MKRLLVVLAAAAFLAACGGGGKSESTTSSSQTAITTTTVVGGTSTTVASSSSTTVVPAKDRCGVSQLQVSSINSDAGAGNRYLTFAMKNVGTVKCTVYGYPGVAAYVGARPLVTKSNRLSNSQPLETIQLSPQQQAYFEVHYAAVPTGNQEQCENADTLQVTPPDTTTQLIVQVAMNSLCPSSGLDVSPLTSKKPS